jgi:hypothetical protein
LVCREGWSATDSLRPTRPPKEPPPVAHRPAIRIGAAAQPPSQQTAQPPGAAAGVRVRGHGRPGVSSVAYAIEAALRADLHLLLPTMSLVVAIIALVIVSYHQLVARYPQGGGAAAAAEEAFGAGWAFVPIGALIVDFVLTIAISAAAGASAVIAYLPALAPWRVPLAVGLVLGVAGLTWFGHLGRAVFALMTLAFVALALAVLVGVAGAAPHPVGVIAAGSGRPAALAVALAFPVAMALMLRSSKVIYEDSPSMAWGRWWATPHPRAGAGVEPAGRHPGRQGDLARASEGLPGQGLAAKQPPPALLQVQPAGRLGMKACWMRGWSTSQVRVEALVWLDRLSVTTTMVPAGLAVSTAASSRW